MKYYFPNEFIERINKTLDNETDNLLEALNSQAPVSVRLNELKSSDLSHLNTKNEVIWCDNAFYLEKRISFIDDPLWHAGAYYVQEASSMSLNFALKQHLPESSKRVLDLCAAPGGKSTLLSSLLTENDLLVSNEIIKNRVLPLCDNLNRWGRANSVVTNSDPQKWGQQKEFFDVLVVDAPCSGEGMFRKEPHARDEWSVANVDNCAIRQDKILDEVLPTLRPGGLLVYSTCTFAEAENELQIKKLIEEGYIYKEINFLSAWGIVNTGFGYRFYPHKITGEGFFLAILAKPKDGDYFPENLPSKRKWYTLFTKQLPPINPFLENPEKFEYILKDEEVFAVPLSLVNEMYHLQKRFKLSKMGVHLGRYINNELIPSHELALYVGLNKNVPRLDLDDNQAAHYLRRQSFEYESSAKGWVIITHKNIPLGWAKLISGRMNNYYPKEIRILKEFGV